MHELLERMEECLDEPAAFRRGARREYHMVERATFASPFVDELVINMYRHLYRHQRAWLAGTRTPVDFLRLDRETVDAIGAGDWLRARRALEFHLIDAAISFLAEAAPGHFPAMLVGVARAERDHRRDAGRLRAGACLCRLGHALLDAATTPYGVLCTSPPIRPRP